MIVFRVALAAAILLPLTLSGSPVFAAEPSSCVLTGSNVRIVSEDAFVFGTEAGLLVVEGRTAEQLAPTLATKGTTRLPWIARRASFVVDLGDDQIGIAETVNAGRGAQFPGVRLHVVSIPEGEVADHVELFSQSIPSFGRDGYWSQVGLVGQIGSTDETTTSGTSASAGLSVRTERVSASGSQAGNEGYFIRTTIEHASGQRRTFDNAELRAFPSGHLAVSQEEGWIVISGESLRTIVTLDLPDDVASVDYAAETGYYQTTSGDIYSVVDGQTSQVVSQAPLGSVIVDESGNGYLRTDQWIGRITDESLIPEPSRKSLDDQITRLYEAYFGRRPDTAGLDYWSTARANGMSIDDISVQFAGSHEFRQTYGELSNQDFASLVYRNVLDRVPEDEGLAFWVSTLDAGTPRGLVMASFSESSEYAALTGTVQATPSASGEVFRLYGAFFGRQPDRDGFCHWVNSRAMGLSSVAIADAFAQSDEFLAMTETLSNADFVSLVYRQVLQRTPDGDGAAFWTNRLDQGLGRGALVVQFSESAENIVRVGITP